MHPSPKSYTEDYSVTTLTFSDASGLHSCARFWPFEDQELT